MWPHWWKVYLQALQMMDSFLNSATSAANILVFWEKPPFFQVVFSSSQISAQSI